MLPKSKYEEMSVPVESIRHFMNTRQTWIDKYKENVKVIKTTIIAAVTYTEGIDINLDERILNRFNV